MRFRIIILILIVLLIPALAESVTLDNLSGPLVPQHRYLYSLDTFYSYMQERGLHGSASFGLYDSRPDYWTIHNALRFSPLKDTEVEIGEGETFSTTYKRLTYDRMDVLKYVNDYNAGQFHAFDMEARHRQGPYEYYVHAYANRQNPDWHNSAGFTEANFFTYIRTHYEDITAGLRHAQDKWAWDARLRYRNGRIRRVNYYYTGGSTIPRAYEQQLRGHMTPEITFQYHIADGLTVHSGLAYTTPYKYKFTFQQTTHFIGATYKMSRQLFIPLRLVKN